MRTEHGSTVDPAVSVRDRAARWWIDPACRPVSTGFEARRTGWFAHVAVATAREQVDGPVRRVLDVGCGPGRVLAVARTRFPGAHLVGLDPDPASLAEAAGHPALRTDTTLLRGRAEDLGSLLDASARFDVATVLLTVALWRDRRGPLAAVLDRLRPGGVLLVLDLVAPHDDGARRAWRDLADDDAEDRYLEDQMAAWPDEHAYRDIADDLARHPRAADTRLALCGLSEVGTTPPRWAPGSRSDGRLPPGPRAALLLARAGKGTGR